MEPALWGFVGTIVGAIASIFTTWLTTRQSATLHSAASRFEREEKARAFQRDTLIELQEVFFESMRLVVQCHHEDMKAFQDGGKWGRNRLPEGLSEKNREKRARLMLLLARVQDNELREYLKRLNSEMTAVSMQTTNEAARNLMMEVTFQLEDAMARMGQVLRSHL